MASTETTWRGRAAWVLRGERLAAVVTRTGGHLAALTRNDDAAQVNPLWNPSWPAGDPRDVAAVDAGTWGPRPEAPLLAAICGSNLCLDRFGAPWPGEERPLHGEAGVTDFEAAASAPGGATTTLAVTATLPLAGLVVRRAFALEGDALRLTTSVQLAPGQAARRQVEWCEHTTLGDPFLDGAEITAAVDTCTELPAAPDAPLVEFAGSLAEALAPPPADGAPAGSVRTCRVAEGAGAWRAANARLGLALSASFDRDAFPWLCLWTESRSRTHAPWAGKQRSRGMEVSTKPFPEGKPPASRASTFLGRPADCFVGLEEVEREVVFTWRRV
jgi:hypothetical protein